MKEMEFNPSIKSTYPSFHAKNLSSMDSRLNIDLVNIFKFGFILLFAYSAVLFFEPVRIPANLLYYLYYFILFGSIAIILSTYKKSDQSLFSFPVFLFMISVVIGGISATINWDQDLYNSIKSILPFLSYAFYFILLVFKLPIDKVERIIFILGISYVFVYLITFILFPLPIFGNFDKYSNERGFQRITLPGMGYLFLLSFYALNKYFIQRNWKWILLYLVSFTCILMSLTRTLIFSTFIVSVLYIMRNSTFGKKVLAIFIIVISGYLILQLDFVQILINKTKSQTENFQDDVRMKAVYYYLNDFSPNTFTKVFGNGEAYSKTGYGKFLDKIERGYGYFAVDIGYIGLYVKFGIFSVLAYILMFIGVIRIRIPDEYLYGKYFIYFTLIISFIIDSTFDSGFIVPISISLFILTKSKIVHNEIV